MDKSKLEKLRIALEDALMRGVQEYLAMGGRLSDLDWFSFRELEESYKARAQSSSSPSEGISNTEDDPRV